MKKMQILLLLLVGIHFTQAQGVFGKIGDAIKKDSLKNKIPGMNQVTQTGLSNEEIIAGLKEALNTGTSKASSLLAQKDGFFANAAIKIMMPEEAQQVEKTLRKFGMSKLVDDAILSMNRAAEDACNNGVDSIFMNAIKKMTIADGMSLLKGNDTAATAYLRKTTSNDLLQKIKPVIESSLQKTNATKYWNDLFSQYNKFSGKKIETDLSLYVSQKGLNGLFYQIAQEEQQIRKNPAARITDLMKKVFGGK
jgi:hypothetical protein